MKFVYLVFHKTVHFVLGEECPSDDLIRVVSSEEKAENECRFYNDKKRNPNIYPDLYFWDKKEIE